MKREKIALNIIDDEELDTPILEETEDGETPTIEEFVIGSPVIKSNNSKSINKYAETLDNTVILPSGFTACQEREIRFGKESGVDTSLYAKPEFTYSQMAEIRTGLEHGIDVSSYLDPNIHWTSMLSTRLYLERKNSYRRASVVEMPVDTSEEAPSNAKQDAPVKARITDSDRVEIYRLYTEEKKSLSEIAKKYGVTSSNIKYHIQKMEVMTNV